LFVLLLVLGAYLAARALRDGRLAWLLASAAAVGLAFETKMLLAFVVVPGIALAYLCFAPRRWTARVWHLAAAGGVLLAVSGAWIAAVELTPPPCAPSSAVRATTARSASCSATTDSVASPDRPAARRSAASGGRPGAGAAPAEARSPALPVPCACSTPSSETRAHGSCRSPRSAAWRARSSPLAAGTEAGWRC
jgi:hypothetical protein